MRYAAFRNLETSRLVLRKFRREDAADYYTRLGSSEEVTKYMLFQPHRDISEAYASVEKALSRYETGKCYRWAIALKEDDRLIGVIEPLRFDEERSACSFAYMLGKDWWRKGYGTEALTEVLRFLFEEMDMALVEADHMAENVGSGAVMRKAGMQYLRTDAAVYEKNGRTYDACRYAITRKQWMNR